MCQLLGMSSKAPSNIAFSFEGFHRRGGSTGEHADGWGIAFFEEHTWRIFLDSQPSAVSRLARFVCDHPIKSRNVIAHIRKATQGEVHLANTHPFRRELWGQEWIFAHNGNLVTPPDCEGLRFQPVGTCDSEKAFCWLLSQIAQVFPQAPTENELAALLKQLAAHLTQSGSFNFLLGWCDLLFAHCSTELWYLIRKAPFSEAHLADADLSIDFSKVNTPDDCMAIIATQPLTRNENWHPFLPGELRIFRNGLPLSLPA
ncbi:MAG: class glutamine amidotransferase [Proteobacteria bacterium]|nr:class glutamine amidotransferase [Pseudomonadota bacterium]